MIYKVNCEILLKHTHIVFYENRSIKIVNEYFMVEKIFEDTSFLFAIAVEHIIFKYIYTSIVQMNKYLFCESVSAFLAISDLKKRVLINLNVKNIAFVSNIANLHIKK